jgi:hypothetical protein
LVRSFRHEARIPGGKIPPGRKGCSSLRARLNIKPGDKFGRLTIITEVEQRNKKRYFLCQCDCGKQKTIWISALSTGNTKSCGCLQREITIRRNFKHGFNRTRLYRIWCHMIGRCQSPKDSHYKYYGGRGISVCDEWRNDFSAFFQWAMANGYKTNLTLDRKNVNGNYEPSNCKWSTWKQQSNNRTNNRYITFGSKTLTCQQWAEEIGIAPGALRYRLNQGWPIGEALYRPLKEKCSS